MDNKTRNKLLDIAAEIIVSPLAAYAAAVDLKRKFEASDAGQKAQATIKQAGEDINAAAQSFAESQTGQLIKDTAAKVGDNVQEAAQNVKETYQKVAESETVQMVRDTAQKVVESETAQKVRDAATETVQKVKESDAYKKVIGSADDAVQKVKETAQTVACSDAVKKVKETVDEVKGMFTDADTKTSEANEESIENIINEAAGETAETPAQEKSIEDLINEVAGEAAETPAQEESIEDLINEAACEVPDVFNDGMNAEADFGIEDSGLSGKGEAEIILDIERSADEVAECAKAVFKD